VLCGQPMGNALLHQTNVHGHSQCLSWYPFPKL
jgi:hypothetical protein